MTLYQDQALYYKTNDLALASAIYLFRPLEEIDRTDSRKAEFIFKRDYKLDQFIERYWRGEEQVNPKQYFNALREIKARLYN